LYELLNSRSFYMSRQLHPSSFHRPNNTLCKVKKYDFISHITYKVVD